MKEPVFIIDGFGYIFRAYYAIRPLSSSKGVPTNAVYGFLSMLQKLIKKRVSTEFIIYDKDYFNLFKKDSGVIVAVLPKDSKYKTLHSLIQSYLEEYGERSSNELKLEEPKFKEDPKSFIELIRYYVSLDKNEVGNLLSHFEAKKFFSIPRVYSFLDRSLLTGLKSITTTGIYFREYYRMKRGKTFQMARDILQEIGKRMKKAGDISEKDDIFYLYKNEVFVEKRDSLIPKYNDILYFRGTNSNYNIAILCM